MKKGWEIRPLEALVVQEKGGIKIGPFGSQLKKVDLASHGVHVVGIENVLSRTFDGLGERFISQEKFEKLRSVEVVPGDLLLTMMGTIGKVAVVPANTCRSIMDSHLLRMRPDPRLIRTDYLAWAIQGSTAVLDAIDAQAHGAIMKGLNSAIVRSLPIPLPSLVEQQRIVGVLDEAFAGLAAAKANAEKNLQNARALFESHLQSVFTRRGNGWVEKRLGDVAEVQSGGTPLVSRKEFWGGRIPWYSSGELNATYTNDPDRYITSAGLAGSNAKLFPKGSLLVGMYDTAALKMSVLDRDGAFNQAIAGIKPNESIVVEFLLHAINSIKPKLLLARRGVRQKNLSLGKIKDIVLPLPTADEQRFVASRIRAVMTQAQGLGNLYQQKLTALDALEKSLLHQAFSGAL